MNHSAPLPALDEEPTNLEKSDLTHAGKFPSNLKGKCWCCKGRAGTGDRMGVGGRTGVSLDLPCSGKGGSGSGDTCRCQSFSVTAIPGFFLEGFAADTPHCDYHYLLLCLFVGPAQGDGEHVPIMLG